VCAGDRRRNIWKADGKKKKILSRFSAFPDGHPNHLGKRLHNFANNKTKKKESLSRLLTVTESHTARWAIQTLSFLCVCIESKEVFPVFTGQIRTAQFLSPFDFLPIRGCIPPSFLYALHYTDLRRNLFILRVQRKNESFSALYLLVWSYRQSYGLSGTGQTARELGLLSWFISML